MDTELNVSFLLLQWGPAQVPGWSSLKLCWGPRVKARTPLTPAALQWG